MIYLDVFCGGLYTHQGRLQGLQRVEPFLQKTLELLTHSQVIQRDFFTLSIEGLLDRIGAPYMISSETQFVIDRSSLLFQSLLDIVYLVLKLLRTGFEFHYASIYSRNLGIHRAWEV